MLGNELDGLTDAALDAADTVVRIPMLGAVASLNVSVAAALILYEAQRQRLEAGAYDESRLDRDVARRTLFEWAYPRIARLCRRRGVPYPELGPDGELLGEVPR
jgi:tRNA (guanosine-2'-O-)-methyltransferase